MATQGYKRFVPLAWAAIFVLIAGTAWYTTTRQLPIHTKVPWSNLLPSSGTTSSNGGALSPPPAHNVWGSKDSRHFHRAKDAPAPWTHRELTSLSKEDGSYFMVDFGQDKGSINPNMIPHPTLQDTWIIVAQHFEGLGSSADFEEHTCLAKFKDGDLKCSGPLTVLPIKVAKPSPNCEASDTLKLLNIMNGPHDARVVYGPQYPVTIYGEKSQLTCFSLWIQDFRVLVDWSEEELDPSPFENATEIQRPPPIHPVEKNYFPFWDDQGEIYAHYDIAPQRAFAKLSPDGSVGPDLALPTAEKDGTCMRAHMPSVGPELEDIHQATNSLSITLCNRADAACIPTNANTFIMLIWQWKSYHQFHGIYEPYVALFRRTAPFDLYGLSNRPYWLRGRGGPGNGRIPDPNANEHIIAEWNQTEMIYITSMAWKEQGMRYHGYQDDIMWLGFGVEDNYTAAMDFRAVDLLQDLQLCDE